MNNGWIKIYRKITQKSWWKRSAYAHLWIHLLLSANHEDKEFFWNGKTIIIKRGQLLTGRTALVRETGTSRSLIERILKTLESEQQIEQQKTNKFRIITIKNYSSYQQIEQQIEQQVSNKRATKEQQVSTNNNVKNVKNNKNNIVCGASAAGKEINDLINLFEPINPSYERLFANKTQRGAIERLLKQYGREKLEAGIKMLPQIIGQKYAPRITTPLQLEEKMGELKIFTNQQKSNKPNCKISVYEPAK